MDNYYWHYLPTETKGELKRQNQLQNGRRKGTIFGQTRNEMKMVFSYKKHTTLASGILLRLKWINTFVVSKSNQSYNYNSLFTTRLTNLQRKSSRKRN